MAKYVQDGDVWMVANDTAVPDYKDALPVGNYNVRHNPQIGYHLTQTTPFTLGKVYGNVSDRVTRILTTYIDRNRNTGVLAVGEKGSGKTLLTQLLSIEEAKHHHIPTIIVDGNPHGNEFNNFLSRITNQCLVLFDEFEKAYEGDNQMSLLTIFDGVYQSNKLFMFTANNEWKIDRSMISRPGRIYYKYTYATIDDSFVKEYCEDKLADQGKIKEIMYVVGMYGGFTFDKLKALVEEVNRYNEDPLTAIEHLNIEFSDSLSRTQYSMQIIVNDEVIYEKPFAVTFNPFTNTQVVRVENLTTDEVDVLDEDEADSLDDITYITLSPDKIIDVKDGQRTVIYAVNQYTVILKERVIPTFDYKYHLKNSSSY